MHGWLIYDDIGAKRNAWFIRELCHSAEKRGVHLEFINTTTLSFGVKEGRKTVLMDGKSVKLPDFVIVRTIFPLLNHFFEECGVRVYNSFSVSDVCNDKRKTHLYFSDAGIPMADTWFYNRQNGITDCFEYPGVLKSADGHGGSEVFPVYSLEDARRAGNQFDLKEFLLQKMVTPGKDVRVYLLAGEVLFAALRSSDRDVRSNFSLGGKVCAYTPCDEMMRIIDLVNKRLSPFYVGIDFTFDQEGRPLLNEIEDVVGSRMIYELTDLPLHDLYIERLLSDLKE